MESRLPRDAKRTRQALLEAAARALKVHGPRISLDVVAREAGGFQGRVTSSFRD